MGLYNAPRPRYNRRDEFVAVRNFIRSGEVVKVGDPVEGRMYVTMSLFRKRLIAPKDHPWTKAAIKYAKLRERNKRKRARRTGVDLTKRKRRTGVDLTKRK